MGSIILQAIKLSPRLFWYSYARPSKSVEFFSQSKRHKIIFVLSYFFSGLVGGSVLAIPHYFLYHNLLQSLVFAGAFVLALLAAVTFSLTLLATDAILLSVANLSLVVLTTTALLIEGTDIASAAAILAVAAFAFTGAGAGELVVTVIGRSKLESIGPKPRTTRIEILIIVFIESSLMLLLVWDKARLIEPYEIIIYPLTFLLGYLFSSSFGFIMKNDRLKKHFEPDKLWNIDSATHQRFGKTQKANLLWAPLIALFLGLLFFIDSKPELHEKAFIMIMSFAVMPIVILHIPDYLICLPIWFYQREKILKKKNGIELMKAFENCLLFKHEMLYLQLPGLHEIIVFMASHREVGIKDAVKSINHLYWFTFQQKQAKRAMATLVNDKEKTHQYIHLLMEVESYLLIKTLAEFNQVAEFYALLFEEVLQSKMKDDYTLSERVEVICREMEKEEGYRFNSKMVHTLQFSKKLLASRSLKDFYSALEILNPHQFPLDIGYFKVFEQISAQLKKIKAGLLKIESLERFETKRHFLNQQKDSLEALTQLANYDLYEPFRTLWQQTLVHCIILVEQEIKLFQGSAELSVDLKNREILISTEERMLYFTIRNKGRELATNVSVTLQTGIPVIDFRSHTGAVINAIEAGTVKELAFPISAPSPGKTTIRGTITFSDLTQEGKTLDFSFPITLLKRSVQFMEIPNPYIVGQPLKGNTPLYFGREDAYAFIDKNITTSDNHHTLVCYGLRRTGKSSLLYRIVNQGLTDPRLTPIMIDLAGIEDEKDFYATISRKVREKLSIPGSVTSVESFSNFKAFLDEIKPAMGEKCIVLMMDEFEALQTLVEKGRISELIFNNIRHLMQHEEKIIFLFCGTHRLEEMSADYWSIFFNTAMYLRISRLKPDDAIRLIKEPVKDGLVYDDLAVEQILKMTGGQPYLIQLICRTLINELNDNKKRNDAVIDDVDDVIEEIITGGTDHFSQQIWDMSTTLERLILSAAAGEMTHKQLDVIGLETLLGQVETVTAQFTRKHMLEMLEKLVSREILAEKEMRYYFPVNLLRKWLAVRHPLRKVREEI